MMIMMIMMIINMMIMTMIRAQMCGYAHHRAWRLHCDDDDGDDADCVRAQMRGYDHH